MPEECSCHGLRVVATVFVLYFFYFSVVCYEWLFLASLAHFPRFCRQYFSLSNAFSIHLARKTYFLPCSGFFGIFFLTFLCCFPYKFNPVVVCWKPWPFSWICVVKTALIWLVLVGFFCVFGQSESICNLHSCYKFALVLHILHSCYRRAALLSQPIRIE